jgi:phosphoglycerate kinase
MAEIGIKSLYDCEVKGKRVLLRLDINSPIDPVTKRIINENRLDKSVPTLRWLLDHGARVAIIAHQGDTLDYQNLIPLSEHAEKLSAKLGTHIAYIDDVCGPAAQARVMELKDGEAVILGNLRYLGEEMSTFENSVKLTAAEMTHTYLVRSLSPLFDLYVNDAFSAAHRNAPSMVAFQQVLPSAAGPLFFGEISALHRIMREPVHPSVFLLGGAKISDAFGMMGQVLGNGSADTILTCGVTGEVFLVASGLALGKNTDAFLASHGLLPFIDQAKELLAKYQEKILMPSDLACIEDGKRKEVPLSALPLDVDFVDIGEETISRYENTIRNCGMVFVNGPAGIYEQALASEGTRRLWKAVEETKGFSVIGGGDSVTAATKFTDLRKIGYVCTAGGAMVRFLSGKELPLVEAMLLAKGKKEE